MKTIFKLLLLIIVTKTINANWDPKEYEKSNVEQFNYAVKELPKINLKGNESVLDIGSGDGKVSMYIAKNYLANGKLHGIDNNKSMIEFAQTRNQMTNTSFEYGNATTYTSSKTYDVITSFWTLHWATDYIATISNIAKLLKPGGKTLLCHIIKSTQTPLDKLTKNLLELPEWNSYKSLYKTELNEPLIETVIEAIKKSNLAIENIEIKKNGAWMPVNLLKQNLLSTPLFNFIPTENRDKFINQYLEKLSLESEFNDKGEIYHWLPVIILVLKK